MVSIKRTVPGLTYRAGHFGSGYRRHALAVPGSADLLRRAVEARKAGNAEAARLLRELAADAASTGRR